MVRNSNQLDPFYPLTHIIVTEQLIRKRSEHNELIISTLEELALHQEDIEKIEHIQNWCRDLKILLLQNNLITKIENLNKLKKLEYLNLSLNNIELIENLEQLESLSKLDLTLNFIGNLQSVANLCNNYNLRELILTGNDCCEYTGYRNFVIVTLPQLHRLDGVDIKRTDRIVAASEVDQCRLAIVQQQIEQQIKRDEQRLRVLRQQEKVAEENIGLTEDEINERFWKKTSEHCPETRVEMAKQERKNQCKNVETKQAKPKRKLFTNSGRPYSFNEPKISFRFEDLNDYFSLDLHVYKYLETSLIDVDVQPNYVRVTIKNKIFQLALSDEVATSLSTSKRSQATGHLLITMPKLSYVEKTHTLIEMPIKSRNEDQERDNNNIGLISGTVDYKHIVKESDCVDDVDESEVPPLC